MREKQRDCRLQQHHGDEPTIEVKVKQEGFWDAELGGDKTRDGSQFVLIFLIEFHLIKKSSRLMFSSLRVLKCNITFYEHV